jgi:hypothetical protein
MIKFDLNPEQRVIRQFAWFAVAGLPLIAWFVLSIIGTFTWSHPAFLIVAGVGFAQLLLYIVGVHAISRWLFIGVTVLAVPIGFLVSHLMLAIIFYLLITPIGLLFRLTGRDVIGRKLDPKATTYWQTRDGERAPSSYFNLY